MSEDLHLGLKGDEGRASLPSTAHHCLHQESAVLAAMLHHNEWLKTLTNDPWAFRRRCHSPEWCAAIRRQRYLVDEMGLGSQDYSWRTSSVEQKWTA